MQISKKKGTGFVKQECRICRVQKLEKAHRPEKTQRTSFNTANAILLKEISDRKSVNDYYKSIHLPPLEKPVSPFVSVCKGNKKDIRPKSSEPHRVS